MASLLSCYLYLELSQSMQSFTTHQMLIAIASYEKNEPFQIVNTVLVFWVSSKFI